MKKKILVMYAPYGSGHKSIANTIYNYFLDHSDAYELKLLDVAKYANITGKLSIKGFDFIIKHRTNHLFSFIYDVADNKIASLNQMALVKKSFDNPKIQEEISSFSPDLTISTHFFASNIISYYNKKGYIHSKIMTVITDYVSHSYWRKYHDEQDAFIVANAMVKNEMIVKKVDAKKVYDYGLPFDRKKLENIRSKQEILFKYNLDPSRMTYLFFGGGSAGSTISFEYLKAIIKCKLPINLIFISGKNTKLENKCRSYVVKHNIKNVKILGFVNDVYSLINASDLVISKPGGATITECMDMKVPMILIPGNGGPEKYNARFMCKKRFGMKVKNSLKLCSVLKKTVKNPNMIEQWKNNLSKCERNESTKKIFELSKKMLMERK